MQGLSNISIWLVNPLAMGIFLAKHAGSMARAHTRFGSSRGLQRLKLLRVGGGGVGGWRLLGFHEDLWRLLPRFDGMRRRRLLRGRTYEIKDT